MRDGGCPRCGGDEVYAASNGLTGFQVDIRPHLEPGFRGVAMPHRTHDLWDHVCAACGYVETYLLDPAAIEFVRRSWRRVESTD